jgi:hypothetical protein
MPHILAMSVNPDTALRDRSCSVCEGSPLGISCCGLCAFWENPRSMAAAEGHGRSWEGQCNERDVAQLLQALRMQGIDLESFEPDQLFDTIRGRTLWCFPRPSIPALAPQKAHACLCASMLCAARPVQAFSCQLTFQLTCMGMSYDGAHACRLIGDSQMSYWFLVVECFLKPYLVQETRTAPVATVEGNMWLIKYAEELPHRGSPKAEPKPGICTLYAEGTRVCFIRIHKVHTCSAGTNKASS